MLNRAYLDSEMMRREFVSDMFWRPRHHLCQLMPTHDLAQLALMSLSLVNASAVPFCLYIQYIQSREFPVPRLPEWTFYDLIYTSPPEQMSLELWAFLLVAICLPLPS
ncbi:hypothetical protein BDV37DRAFT_236634 [Aspergillus pseudonomiae]|uniref:Uncharacterized protein n=1 Tax=Aspergillus pseudonomiae TaxID=1506151 RepID=A0A5N7DTG4_9EURO|nr:uncharacterized protein BDV37DRAFT_236634 [Aspergillus pseudonomiae]KAE8409684.1 hypothetical protein BDV37DRAFT_236634 [Aspergillus pseudonomiae]